MNNKFQSINGIEKIDEAIIIKIVKSDPTYNDNTQRGKYSYWLLNLYINKNLKLEDLYKANEYLTSFEKNKKYLANKDIQQYHSLQDLYISLEKTEAPKLTKSQFNRQVRHIPLDDNINIKHYMSTKCYDIYIPLTYEGSIRLGKGTQWCTSTEKTDEHYKRYTKDGTLYVLINKKDPTKKYQFQDKDCDLADKNDNYIDIIDFVMKNRSLIDFFGEKVFGGKDKLEEKLSKIKELSSEVIYDGKQITCNGVIVTPDLYGYITKLVIREGVEKIGKKLTFENEVRDDDKTITHYYFRNLNEVVFPESLKTIGDYCLSLSNYWESGGLRLSSIYIPKNVSKIGKHFLSGIPLTKIVVDKDNKTYDSRGNCNAIIETKTNTLIKGSSSTIIPKSISSLDVGSFWGNPKLKKIYIPDNIKQIGDVAFECCVHLKHVRLPKNIKKIGKSTFYHCFPLKINKLPDSLEEIADWAFYHINSINNFTLPKNICRIGKNAFYFNEKNFNYKVIIPEHLEEIDATSFNKSICISVNPKNKKYDSRNNCNAIIETKSNKLICGCNNTVIPSDIKTIQSYSFYDCEIGELTIPSSVEEIEQNAFEDTKIYKLLIDCPSEFAKYNFNCEINEFVINEKVERLFEGTFNWCEYISKLVLPPSLKKIDSHAFNQCNLPLYIKFLGSKKQWESIYRGHEWFLSMDNHRMLTVYCSDGKVIEKI